MKYGGFRFRAEAKLAGKLYGQRFGVDVAFGDPILDAPESVVAETAKRLHLCSRPLQSATDFRFPLFDTAVERKAGCRALPCFARIPCRLKDEIHRRRSMRFRWDRLQVRRVISSELFLRGERNARLGRYVRHDDHVRRETFEERGVHAVVSIQQHVRVQALAPPRQKRRQLTVARSLAPHLYAAVACVGQLAGEEQTDVSVVPFELEVIALLA